jgi:hypothetical protein
LGSLSGGLNAHNPAATEPEDTPSEVAGNAPSSSKGKHDFDHAVFPINQSINPSSL